MKLFLLMMSLFFSGNVLAESTSKTKNIQIVEYSSSQFAVNRNQAFTFQLTLAEEKTISVDIVSADKDLAKTILTKQLVKAGEVALSWDGKDSGGKLVPNEAWYPVVHIYQGDNVDSIYPSEYSGGEIIQEVPVKITGGNLVTVTLSEPARLLVRSGLKAGPMLRSLSNWQAKDKGVHKIHWDGLDESGVYPFAASDDFGVMATAFRLPDHAIVTYGNDAVTYPQWRKALGFEELPADTVGKIAEKRDGKALSKVYFKPKYLPTDPRVSAEFLNTKDEVPTLSDITSLKVDMPIFDRGIVEKSLYEVGFFVDGVFISEEEQGYVPFIWRFDPMQFEPGEHYLTVNISGFDGQVGIVTVKFITPTKA